MLSVSATSLPSPNQSSTLCEPCAISTVVASLGSDGASSAAINQSGIESASASSGTSSSNLPSGLVGESNILTSSSCIQSGKSSSGASLRLSCGGRCSR